MEYRITIDGTSPLARLHDMAAQSFIQLPVGPSEQDERARSTMRHPVLHCAQVDFSHPSLLRALIAPHSSDVPAVVWIPYSHILGILEVGQLQRADEDRSDQDEMAPRAETQGEARELLPVLRFH